MSVPESPAPESSAPELKRSQESRVETEARLRRDIDAVVLAAIAAAGSFAALWLLPLVPAMFINFWQVFFVLPLILGGIGLFAFCVAVVGAVMGWLVLRLEHPFSVTLVGMVPGLLMAMIAKFSLNSVSWEDWLVPTFQTFVIGVFSAVTAVAAKRNWPRWPSFNRTERRILAGLLVLVVSSYALMGYSSYLAGQVHQAGGTLSRNDLDDPKGRYVISFRSTPLNDPMLLELLPTLRQYPRLELDLAHTQVTDSGVAKLTTLPSLTRLRVDHTAISKDQITQLRQAMPQVDIRENWP